MRRTWLPHAFVKGCLALLVGGGGCRGVASFAFAQRRSRACRGRVQWSMKRLVAVFRETMPVIPAPTQRHPPGRSPDGTRSLPHVPAHFTPTSIAPPHTPRVALRRRVRVRVRPTRPSWGPTGRGHGRASIAPFNVRRKGSRGIVVRVCGPLCIYCNTTGLSVPLCCQAAAVRAAAAHHSTPVQFVSRFGAGGPKVWVVRTSRSVNRGLSLGAGRPKV